MSGGILRLKIMQLLQPSEYDASYFDGAKQATRHNAGYSEYERWKRFEGEGSLGEYWKDLANKFSNTHALQNKKVLEIGCAKGFVVEDLRELGVDAYGLDVSAYAIGEASEAVKSYLTVGDIRTALAGYSRNEFDVVFSLRTLECFSEAELPDIIAEMNRISRKQIHVIDETSNSNFYLEKPLSWWQGLGFQKLTFLVSNQSKKLLIK